MDWHERIVVDPNILVGKPVIRGTRIAVELVIDLLARGYTKEENLGQYDHIASEDIQAHAWRMPARPCVRSGSTPSRGLYDL